MILVCYRVRFISPEAALPKGKTPGPGQKKTRACAQAMIQA
jgi:hypothetical protein